MIVHTAGKLIRVLIVDDHPVVRMGMASMLSTQPGVIVQPSASSGAESISLYTKERADIVLMDLRMPHMSGIETIRRLRKIDPHVRILVVTNYETDEDIYTALRDGALGYLTKDVMPDEMLQAIRAVAAGRRHVPPALAQRIADVMMRPALTPRETEILRMLVTGWTNKRIGQEMHISENTVRNHVNHIFSKLEVADRTEAAMVAVQRGLVLLSDGEWHGT